MSFISHRRFLKQKRDGSALAFRDRLFIPRRHLGLLGVNISFAHRTNPAGSTTGVKGLSDPGLGPIPQNPEGGSGLSSTPWQTCWTIKVFTRLSFCWFSWCAAQNHPWNSWTISVCLSSLSVCLSVCLNVCLSSLNVCLSADGWIEPFSDDFEGFFLHFHNWTQFRTTWFSVHVKTGLLEKFWLLLHVIDSTFLEKMFLWLVVFWLYCVFLLAIKRAEQICTPLR